MCVRSIGVVIRFGLSVVDSERDFPPNQFISGHVQRKEGFACIHSYVKSCN